EDADDLAAHDAEASETMREVAHALVVLGPRDRLPDSVAFFLERHVAGAEGRQVGEEARKGPRRAQGSDGPAGRRGSFGRGAGGRAWGGRWTITPAPARGRPR